MKIAVAAAVVASAACMLLGLYCLYLKNKIKKVEAGRERQLSELEEKLQDEYSVRMVDKQAKLSALQSQINPHFLYNTLECIRSEALLYDCDSIARMAKALASFFRYSISKKENIVTLREEFNNIENYFLIQSYRFDDKFSFEILAAPEDREAYSCLIPKLSLQPIVENAIFHGLETKPDKGKVTIRVEMTEKNVIIIVSDDGVGIGREELERMRDSLKNSKKETDKERKTSGERGNGIALTNVSQRIKLIFGDDYGLNLYSTKGIGTDVEIILPIMTDKSLL
ncbi:histidine kinase/DNA gyrase B/HSP90-like ATPase [Hungatella effluvii]|uniref:histidine kinase n=1 Tax=Hungatella effluvii TaxID=1096246 RepID=A0A2V3Y5E6_9FIRM|nr:sensor histidine kinase [Hungatella effluvii]PXX53703.1 histidine kinase/DNA gyrase B/HSP90-like ATPase [Hungatella effluvii]